MTGFSFAAAFAAVVVAFVGEERLRRLRRVIAAHPAELARALRSSRGPNRLPALAAATRGESAVREADLLDSVVSGNAPLGADSNARVAPPADSNARVALLNEQLRDLERDLGWGERIPAVLGRVSLLVSFVCLCVAITTGVTEALPLLAIVVWGVAGMVAVRASGRAAVDTARGYRQGVDALVAAALAALASDGRHPVSTRGGRK